jgi:hypothetical protein
VRFYGFLYEMKAMIIDAALKIVQMTVRGYSSVSSNKR